jgi:hypothetical protein
MVERRQLNDEHIALWSEGCALLQAMSPREYDRGESDRYYEFRAVDKRLTWQLVGPHSYSLFSSALDGPPHEYVTSSHLQYVDRSTAQTWRTALNEATAITPKDRRMESYFLRPTTLQGFLHLDLGIHPNWL